MHCRVNVPSQTRIMTIPVKFLVTVEMGKDTIIGRQMVKHDVDITAA